MIESFKGDVSSQILELFFFSVIDFHIYYWAVLTITRP
jgi:hypothetical protein